MERYRRIYASVDLDAVKSNMEAMKNNLPEKTRMIGVVKADGYGHGSVPVARAIDEYVAGYAVATAEEGMILRRHGIKKPVLILGAVHESYYPDLIRLGIRPALFQMEKLEKFSRAARSVGKKAPVHLALDTGMGRIGMRPDEESADMVKEASLLPGVELEGLFTHFARADETDLSSAGMQLKRYQDFLSLLEDRGVHIPVCHCANSAGIIRSVGTGFDMVRAGISIYGMYPSDEVGKTAVALKPAMSLKSFLTFVKTVEPGTQISYGGTFTAQKKMKVATVPAGYGDGYPRNVSGKGYVLIHGRKAAILGRVCMDQFMVDVTDIEQVKEDDEVTLIGRDQEEEIKVEDLARWGGGFHYEIVCDIGKRVPRVYVLNGQVIGTKDYFDDTYKDFVS